MNGELQTMVSLMWEAMKRLMPEPSPYPRWSISSSMSSINPEKASWATMRMAFPSPMAVTSPYIPDVT